MQNPQYPIDPGNANEGYRLSLQDGLLNNLFPLLPDGTQEPTSVLDLACGTGGWLRDVIQRYPQARCVGLDKSTLLLDHAQSVAKKQRLTIEYKRGDMFDMEAILKGAHFDFIHMRCATWFLGPRVQEMLLICQQMLLPGGTFCLIDFRHPFRSNSDAMRRFTGYFMDAMQKRGTTYASIDEVAQIFSMLHLDSIQRTPFSLDISTGVEGREGFVSDLRNVFVVFKSMMLDVLGEEEYENIASEALHDLDAPGFELFGDALMISGQKKRAGA